MIKWINQFKIDEKKFIEKNKKKYKIFERQGRQQYPTNRMMGKRVQHRQSTLANKGSWSKIRAQPALQDMLDHSLDWVAIKYSCNNHLVTVQDKQERKFK